MLLPAMSSDFRNRSRVYEIVMKAEDSATNNANSNAGEAASAIIYAPPSSPGAAGHWTMLAIYLGNDLPVYAPQSDDLND